MRTEFIKRYGHTWRVFQGIVRDFDEDAWFHTGRGPITPARLSFHILKAVKYYIEDSSTVCFKSGKLFDNDSENVKKEYLPSQKDVLACIDEMREKTERWLAVIDFNADNSSFGWAGETKLGVVLFLFQHSVYHIGELSSLLNESLNGDAEDNYVKAL